MEGIDLGPRREVVDPVSSALRDELIAWIASEALGGDLDAAEWVLLTSIARVYVIHHVHHYNRS